MKTLKNDILSNSSGRLTLHSGKGTHRFCSRSSAVCGKRNIESMEKNIHLDSMDLPGTWISI